MKHILDKFPSLRFVADEVGVKYKAVTKWRERQSIPAKYDLRLLQAAQKCGERLTLEEIAEARAHEEGAAK